MKRLLLIVLPLLLIVGCSKEPINYETTLIDRDGVYYTKDTNKPYSGQVFSLYDDGKKKEEGTCKDGRLYGKWTFYSVDGEIIREFDYSKINSNNLKNYLLGEWSTQYEVYNGDTTSFNENEHHIIVKYLPDKIIVRLKTNMYEFLEYHRWYQWLISDIEYTEQNIYKLKNRIFTNNDFIDYAKENGFYESLLNRRFTEFEINITGPNSFTERSISNEGDQLLLKNYRVN